MDNIVVNSYLSIFDRLDLDSKLALLAGLTENIRASISAPKTDKTKLLYELAGSWSDVDEGIIDEIYISRTVSERDITFD